MDVEKTGRLIAEVRREKGLTQRELAERLHVSDRAVSKWERGINLPEAGHFEPLCALLGITVTELLRGEREEATVATLEQAVDAAVALMKEQERKRSWRFAAEVLAVLLVLTLVMAVPLLLSWQRHRKLDSGLPPVPVLTFRAAPYTTMGWGLIPCGRNDVLGPEGTPMTVEPAVSLPNGTHDNGHFIRVLWLEYSRSAEFELAYGMSALEVKVLRWPYDRKGTGLGLEDGETVEFYTFWDNSEDSGPYRGRTCVIDELEPDYLYSIIISWGEGYYREYPFRTVAEESQRG